MRRRCQLTSVCGCSPSLTLTNAHTEGHDATTIPLPVRLLDTQTTSLQLRSLGHVRRVAGLLWRPFVLTRLAPRLERSGNPEEDQPQARSGASSMHSVSEETCCTRGQTQQFLLCLTVGVKLKETVGKIVARFDLQQFAVMLFHYDGQVDAWSEMPWHDAVVHVRLRECCSNQLILTHRVGPLTGVCKSAEQVVVC